MHKLRNTNFQKPVNVYYETAFNKLFIVFHHYSALILNIWRISGLMESCWFFAHCSWDFKLILVQTLQHCGYINIFPLAFSLVATSGWESPSVSLYRYYETLPSVAAFKLAAVPSGYSSLQLGMIVRVTLME